MQSLLIAWRVLSLVSIFAFPQLLGILLYFRLRWAPRWLATIVGILAPVVLFVLLAPIFLYAGAREAAARGEGCGMLAFGAFLMWAAGTLIELGLGVVTQIVLATRRRRRKVVSTTS